MEKLPRVSSVSDETKYIIKRKSAYTLPNNPSREGMKPAEIKRAFWGPMVDTANSLLSELERVIGETNAFIQATESELGEAEGSVTRAEKLMSEMLALKSNVKAYAEHAAVAREKSESAAVESRYYSELSRKAMENREGSRTFVVDTIDDLLSFVKEGRGLLYRVVDGVRVPYAPKDLETGDTIYVKALDVPDFWWIKTDTEEGAFVYEGETMAYPLTESHTIADRMAEIDAAIAEQNATLSVGETVVNTDGDALVPDYDWYLYGVGSEEEPYRIGSPAALLALSNLSNGLYDPAVLGEKEVSIKYFDGCYFVQTANIDMGGIGFMPISFEKRESYDSPTTMDNYDALFYNGAGHYISGFVQSGYRVGGIFGNIGGGGCVENLTLKDSDITANADAGGIVGVALAGLTVYNCHTENCVIKSQGISNGDSVSGCAGGIVGYFNLNTGYAPATVSYCSNSSEIKSAVHAGGLIGYIKGQAVSKILYCANRGDVTVESSQRVAIGGIVGWANKISSTSPSTTYIFEHCYNTGTLAANTSSTNLFMGGIAGDVRGTTGTVLDMSYCYDNSVRSYAKSSGDTMNHAIIGIYDNSQIYKQYQYCHASNKEGSTSTYSALGHYMDTSNVSTTGCSIVATSTTLFADTFFDIICQLQPLESTAKLGDMETALDKIIAIQEDLIGGGSV